MKFENRAADVSTPAQAGIDERQAFEADYAKALGHTVQEWELKTAWRMMIGDMWRAARAAAPVVPSGTVSGQGYGNTLQAAAACCRMYGSTKLADAVLEIDSRPRSEDSRAKVLSDAIGAVGALECSRDDYPYLMRAMAAIRALATSAAPERCLGATKLDQQCVCLTCAAERIAAPSSGESAGPLYSAIMTLPVPHSELVGVGPKASYRFGYVAARQDAAKLAAAHSSAPSEEGGAA